MRIAFGKACLVVIVALFVSAMLWKVSEPFVLVRELKAETAPLEAEASRLRAENRQLEEEIAQLDTPEMLELEARRQGWINPGERRIVFRKSAESKPSPYVPAPEANTPLFDEVEQWAHDRAARLLGRTERAGLAAGDTPAEAD